MTVKLYVSQDSEGRQWPPDHAHEVGPVQQIAEQLWLKLHHHETLYVMLANLHDPSADLVVFTERGLGVMELKHVRGVITMDSARWYADNNPIKSGVSYDTPRIQVQKYAETIRGRIWDYIVPKHIRSDKTLWDQFKFQTAVCFTNPAADVTGIKDLVLKGKDIQRRPWEDFTIQVPEKIPEWVSCLRFGVTLDRSRSFDQYQLKAETLVNVVELVLKATEWTELLTLMPDGEPWGYLVITGEHQTQKIGLIKDTISVGRDPECTIVVPDSYGRVSRRHIQITRMLGQVLIKDLGSKIGSFINSEKIVKERRLTHDELIVLGGPQISGGNYALQFKLRSREKPEINATVSE